MASHAKTARPQMTSELDMDDDMGFLGTPRFKAYSLQVLAVIHKTKRPLSIGDMRRALGDNFVDRFHADALEYLMSDSTIREVPSGLMSRYEPASRIEPVKKKNKKDWANTLSISPRDLTSANIGVASSRRERAA